MTPLEQLTNAIRALLSERRGATPAEIEHLRQIALHVIDYDTNTTEDQRAALRDALDLGNRPDARSFLTDSGWNGSRRP